MFIQCFFRLSNFGAALGVEFLLGLCSDGVNITFWSLDSKPPEKGDENSWKLIDERSFSWCREVKQQEGTGILWYSPIIKRCLLGEPSPAAQSATLHQDVKCRGCGEVVKSDSNYCRHCGVPIKAREVGADQWANWVNFEGKLGYPKFMHIFIFSYIRIYIHTLYFTGIILVGFNGYFNNFEPLEYLNLLSFLLGLAS